MTESKGLGNGWHRRVWLDRLLYRLGKGVQQFARIIGRDILRDRLNELGRNELSVIHGTSRTQNDTLQTVPCAVE